MRPAHFPFFDDEPPATATDRSLVLRSSSGRPLGKKERAFNRLVQKVQALRARLESEKQRLDAALLFHAEHVLPRMQRVTALRKEVVRTLVPFLDDRRLKEADRRALRTILSAQLDEILRQDPAPDQDLQDLFERLHGIAFTQAVRDDLDEARDGVNAAFESMGLDIEIPELRPGMTDDELAATFAKLADQFDRAEQAAQHAPPSRHRKTKAQLREQERLHQMERLHKLSIGAVYRRLVKVLQPDLEQDAALRERKSALMQDVTAAYRRHDMHALLRLELEWIGRKQIDAARLSAEMLDAYLEALKQQAAELEAECTDLRMHPRYQPLLVQANPFEVPTLIDGPSEVRRLDLAIEVIADALARMAAGHLLRDVRALIREHREAERVQQRLARRFFRGI